MLYYPTIIKDIAVFSFVIRITIIVLHRINQLLNTTTYGN
jgi:hypothetical protein